MANNFLIPLVLDYQSKAYIYGEEGPNLLFNYQFDDVSDVISLEQMRNTFKYKDNGDNNGIIFKYDVDNGITEEEWHSLITKQILSSNNNYRNSYIGPTEGPLSHHIIQWITSTLFGHPQAQAPLTNEEQIILDVSNGTIDGSTDGVDVGQKLGRQIYDKLKSGISGVDGGEGSSNVIIQSIYEQMVNDGRFTVDVSSGDITFNAPVDTEGFLSLPFKEGDKLSFLIKIQCDLVNDNSSVNGSTIQGTTGTTGWEASTSSSLTNLFGNINGVNKTDTSVSLVPEVWKFTFQAN
jgi:hypothetical protein